MTYRDEARRHLARFEEESASGDSGRLRYAALELRLAMEALTYDRALAYRDELPPSEYETWQPAKLMAVLIDIDPTADQDSSLRIGREEEYGVVAPAMTLLGSERVLSMATLKGHYHALGSYLHTQSLKQRRSGTPLDFYKMRSRCEKIAEAIRKVLSSSVLHITLGNFFTLPCMECEKPIRRRFPHGKSEVNADCRECDASYTLVDKGNGQVKWNPRQQQVECGRDGCGHEITLWVREITVGRFWQCPKCDGRNTLGIGIVHEPA
ncbi:MAG: hypothetical protein F4Z50_16430 [Gemmatimonadetes bacterium]|nr:hypothetical protein [Gemmatimonadota bacterium]MYC90187.1 hypothetical protein [Gemmatimonadota bacterium]